MMKHKTAELTGALLDAAVAMAFGHQPGKFLDRTLSVQTLKDGSLVCLIEPYRPDVERFINADSGADPDGWLWAPSRSWAQGGPIIDAKHFNAAVHWGTDFCGVEVREDAKPYTMFYGKDMLEAYMRALVWWKLGEEVELP